MAPLLLGVLALHVIVLLVSTYAAAIDSLVWALFLRLPVRTARAARERSRLKLEVLHLKRDMNATSAQDEFAKWAKLRRKHDKTLEQYENLNKELTSTKLKFDMAVKTIRWGSTNGLKFFLLIWYSKTPVFVLPPRWLPWPVEWILSFPRAPMGTVSINTWSASCGTVVALLGAAICGATSNAVSEKAATQSEQVASDTTKKDE